MRGAMEMRTAAVRAAQVRDMYYTLLRKGVGTGEVEAAARAAVGPRNNYRDPNEVRRVLRRRWSVAYKSMVLTRLQWKRADREVKEVVDGVQRDQYEAVMRRLDKGMDEMKACDCRKIEWLEKKYGKKGQHEEERCYKVKDDELNKVREDRGEAKPTNFTVYGNIAIDKDEEAALNLGPKFMKLVQLNKENTEVETEVYLVQQRMELRKRSELRDENGLASGSCNPERLGES
jgi:hypothetical protein